MRGPIRPFPLPVCEVAWKLLCVENDHGDATYASLLELILLAGTEDGKLLTEVTVVLLLFHPDADIHDVDGVFGLLEV